MEIFGTLPSGEEIYLLRLRTSTAEAAITSYGARIVSFKPHGREIIAGFDCLDDYVNSGAVHGASIGRVCNRISNANFVMDGVRYDLTKNNGEACLHGGADNYAKKAWDVVRYDESSVLLSYLSEDGESGFPGEVRVYAEYRLIGNALRIEYYARPLAKTPIMITNHAFFNLNGFTDTVLSHKLRIFANEYSEVDETRVPTGRRISVADTPFDFREAHEIGERIAMSPLGYDTNFVVSGGGSAVICGEELPLIAEVVGDGVKMSLYSDQKGVQLYVPQRWSERAAPYRGGVARRPEDTFCLETQIEPDCVSHGVGFVEAGELYRSVSVYKVDVI